jgi:hypothetical protein
MPKTLLLLLTFLLALAAGCHHAEQAPQAAQAALINEDSDPTRTDTPKLIGATESFLTAPFDFIGQQIALSRGNTPARAAREMDDPSASPDTHRQGIVSLVTQWNFTHRPPYTTRYKQIAQNDPNETVRAMAIRALNISRDKTATPIFIAALEDDSEIVRLEAAKALANIPDPNAIPALLRRLEGKRDVIAGTRTSNEESKEVRIAAADALRHYRTLEVARSLVNELDQRDFGVAWQSNKSLISLTGQNFDYDESAWLQYLTGPKKPFG